MSLATMATLRRRALEQWAEFERWRAVVDKAEQDAAEHFRSHGIDNEYQVIGEVAARTKADFWYQRAVVQRNIALDRATMYATLCQMEVQWQQQEQATKVEGFPRVRRSFPTDADEERRNRTFDELDM